MAINHFILVGKAVWWNSFALSSNRNQDQLV